MYFLKIIIKIRMNKLKLEKKTKKTPSGETCVYKKEKRYVQVGFSKNVHVYSPH